MGRSARFRTLLVLAAAWLSVVAPARATLTPPLVDDRRFADLTESLVARIPAHAPEWSNYEDSDPGTSLLELFDLLGATGIGDLLDDFQHVPPWETLPRDDEKYWQQLGYVTMEAGLMLIAPDHPIGSDWPASYWPQTYEQVMLEQYEKFRSHALVPEPRSLPLSIAAALLWRVARRRRAASVARSRPR